MKDGGRQIADGNKAGQQADDEGGEAHERSW